MCVCLSVYNAILCKPPKGTSIDSDDTITFGCQLASTYLALDFWGSQNHNAFSILQCQGVSVGSGIFMIFHVFRKKFPRGPGDAFCGFVCFRASEISGYFRELNKNCVDVYKSPGCFAALRRYPCLRVQSSKTFTNVSSEGSEIHCLASASSRRCPRSAIRSTWIR